MEIMHNETRPENWATEFECSKNIGGCGTRFPAKAEKISLAECWANGKHVGDKFVIRCPRCGRFIKIEEALLPDFVKKDIIQKSKHRK